ncbi:DEAD/DEAH box helicase [Orbaceae bacterium ac157xtp]
MELDIFNICHSINNSLNTGNESLARDELIKLLDYCKSNNIAYTPLINHLIKDTGLYPYIDQETADWQERFAYQSFKINTGDKEPITLHRGQSILLQKLLGGQSIAVSAPTSFGKSFIIDAFIAITKPKNVMLIVPTLALTDETRRRINKKFANEYKIITTTDATLSAKNIFIFPQERAINYVNKVESIDILIIDEFYKASEKFDKERSPMLLRVLLKLNKKTKQKYFLAPNIKNLNNNFFTEGMEFIPLDFNTVYLEKYDLFEKINNDLVKKSKIFIDILKKSNNKSLVYAGTFKNINEISKLIQLEFNPIINKKLNYFAEWLNINYNNDNDWILINLIKRGCGIHNGRLHRSLSQIQIKLFEETDGLRTIISTSSIIEGVNTSAENVILWSNKNGKPRLNDFSYRNIIGRGGRMFKHFVGKIFILEPPPNPENEQLNLAFTEKLLFDTDEQEYSQVLTKEQIAAIISYKEEMSSLLTFERYKQIQDDGLINNSDAQTLLNIAKAIKFSPEKWQSLKMLNSINPEDWKNPLHKVLQIKGCGSMGVAHKQLIDFICSMSNQWGSNIPQLLLELNKYSISIDDFFNLERIATNKLVPRLNDVNLLLKAIIPESGIDFSAFIFKLSYMFLPPVVFQLEEYGLPRMISKKIQTSNIIDFTEDGIDLYSTIELFNKIGFNTILENIKNLHFFDKYILEYFYEGITSN